MLSHSERDGIVVNKLSRNYDPFIRPSSADAEATLELKRILLQNSRDVLRTYLFRFREMKGYASIGEDAQKIFECVDLVLLTLILEMSKDEGKQVLYDLIHSGIDCFEEAEKLLIEKERYYVLSILYQSRGMIEKVLETWGKMIDGTWPDEEFKNGEDRMRDYLIKCRDGELVFKFAMWLTRRNPEAGVQVEINLIELIVGSCWRCKEARSHFHTGGDHCNITRRKSSWSKTLSRTSHIRTK